MVVSKHLTHFCYPIRLVNSHIAYPGNPGTTASADIAVARGLNFQVGCQGRRDVNSDADEIA